VYYQFYCLFLCGYSLGLSYQLHRISKFNQKPKLSGFVFKQQKKPLVRGKKRADIICLAKKLLQSAQQIIFKHDLPNVSAFLRTSPFDSCNQFYLTAAVKLSLAHIGSV
jgi:hypothetical protein